MFDFIKQGIDQVNRFIMGALAGLGLPTGISSAISGIATLPSEKLKSGENWQGIPLERGHYIFYADAPSGLPAGLSLEKTMMLETSEGKRIQVNWILYHIKEKQVEIGVRIYDNPIPMLVVWGLVMTALITISGLISHLVLTDVKKVITTPGGMMLGGLALLVGLRFFIKAGGIKGLKGG